MFQLPLVAWVLRSMSVSEVSGSIGWEPAGALAWIEDSWSKTNCKGIAAFWQKGSVHMWVWAMQLALWINDRGFRGCWRWRKLGVPSNFRALLAPKLRDLSAATRKPNPWRQLAPQFSVSSSSWPSGLETCNADCNYRLHSAMFEPAISGYNWLKWQFTSVADALWSVLLPHPLHCTMHKICSDAIRVFDYKTIFMHVL